MKTSEIIRIMEAALDEASRSSNDAIWFLRRTQPVVVPVLPVSLEDEAS